MSKCPKTLTLIGPIFPGENVNLMPKKGLRRPVAFILNTLRS
jgi:hypothetical protein